MNEKRFELGERRRVSLEVWLNGGQSFHVANCTWQLANLGAEEDSGSCEVEQSEKGWVLTAEVQPRKAGSYTLQFTFHVGSEIIKRTVKIQVMRYGV